MYKIALVSSTLTRKTYSILNAGLRANSYLIAVILLLYYLFPRNDLSQSLIFMDLQHPILPCLQTAENK